MKLESKHKDDIVKLESITDDLIKAIAKTDNQELMGLFLEWQEQRNICNEGFVNMIKKSCYKKRHK